MDTNATLDETVTLQQADALVDQLADPISDLAAL